MVSVLHDDEYLLDIMLEKSEAKGRLEGETKGRLEGEAKGRLKGEAIGIAKSEAKIQKIIECLRKEGYSEERINKILE